MAFPWMAVAAGVGTAASLIGSSQAADAEDKANRSAIRQVGVANQQQLALSQPTLQAGNSALRAITGLLGLPDPGGPGTPGVAPGLNEVPGVFWQGRPVFQDEGGALYAPRGRDATVGSAGVELIGTPTDSPNGVRLAGKFLRDSRGQRVRSDSEGLFSKQGERFQAREPVTVDNETQQVVSLQDLIGNSPILEAQRRLGERSIERNAAARGLNESGGTLRDLAAFNNDLVTLNTQNQVLNPLFQLAGFGQNQIANNQQIIGNNSSSLANLALNRGASRSSAFQNRGNTLGNFIAGSGEDLFNIFRRRSGPDLTTLGGVQPNGFPF